MATAFRRKGDLLVAKLDRLEREVVSVLMVQTRDLLAPADTAARAPETDGDAFDELVATLDLEDMPGDELGPVSDAGTAAGTAPTRTESRDPALDRLLPSANREDPEAAAEFRRLTEHGLRQRKSENLTIAIEALAAVRKDRLELDQRQAAAFVVSLVDVRLLLGDRLGLLTDEDADALHRYVDNAGPDDPRASLGAYYDFLTWLQESLTQALMR